MELCSSKRIKAGSAQAETCCVYVKSKKHMHDITP